MEAAPNSNHGGQTDGTLALPTSRRWLCRTRARARRQRVRRAAGHARDRARREGGRAGPRRAAHPEQQHPHPLDARHSARHGGARERRSARPGQAGGGRQRRVRRDRSSPARTDTDRRDRHCARRDPGVQGAGRPPPAGAPRRAATEPRAVAAPVIVEVVRRRRPVRRLQRGAVGGAQHHVPVRRERPRGVLRARTGHRRRLQPVHRPHLAMACSSTAPIIYTGGNHASVFIMSACVADLDRGYARR